MVSIHALNSDEVEETIIKQLCEMLPAVVFSKTHQQIMCFLRRNPQSHFLFFELFVLLGAAAHDYIPFHSCVLESAGGFSRTEVPTLYANGIMYFRL